MDRPSSPWLPDLPSDLPGLPRTGDSLADGLVFREPWEAQAFAMAVKLHEAGIFTWSEWAAALAREIEAAQAAGDPDTGENYYRHWLAALERMVGERGIADAVALARRKQAWADAAARTPHGQPIELAPGDEA